MSEARSRAEETKKHSREAAARERAADFLMSYKISHMISHNNDTSDITNHGIIVGIVTSLVICDIMFYNCCCQSTQQNELPERVQRRVCS